jgi:predicted ArsR family transcriptional regulator
MQPDLFNAAPQPHKLARRGAPTTSKLAALEVPRFATQHHAAIVQVLKDHGARGLTVHEIATYCRLDAHAIGNRMNELERAKIVEVHIVPDGDSPDGYTVLTRPSPTGRAARVWFLANGGAA